MAHFIGYFNCFSSFLVSSIANIPIAYKFECGRRCGPKDAFFPAQGYITIKKSLQEAQEECTKVMECGCISTPYASYFVYRGTSVASAPEDCAWVRDQFKELMYKLY